MKAKIITVGDELLIGQVIDTNSAWIGEHLNLLGVKIVEIQSIQDDHTAIIEALDASTAGQVDLILMTGGLGPTKDDITKKAIADFLNDEMVFHDETYQRILRLFERLKRTPTPDHKDQCYMPKQATILKNKMGTAPGMWFEHRGTIIVSMPGVPYEMKYLIEHEVIPRISPKLGGQHIIHETIRTVGEGESRIAASIEDIEELFPKGLTIAYLPSLGQVRLRLTATGTDKESLEENIAKFKKQIVDRLGALVFGYGKETLEENLGKMAIEKGLTIGTAESCTGGMIAQKIASIPGASAYFNGSIIAYSNDVKKNILSVSKDTLHDHGAVSEQTVKEMVVGAIESVHCNVAVAVSGVAGPGGGTTDKPVGTIWLACGNKTDIRTVKLELSKNRQQNIEYSTTVAMNMLRKFLMRQ